MKAVLLGRVAFVDGGSVHSVPRAQTRGLLALLALHAGRHLSYDVIIEALWGGADPSTARAQVQTAASTIRRQLAALGSPGAIVADRYGYQLTIPPDDVDAIKFEQLVREARGDLAGGRFAAAAERSRAALALWRDDPLLDAAGAFVDAARARAVDHQVSAWEHLAEAELVLGGLPGLVDDLSTVLAAHPIREQLCLQVMRALYAAGRQVDALRVFRDYRRVLAEREGLDPGPAIVRLESLILRGEPLPGAPPQGAATPNGPSADIAGPAVIVEAAADHPDAARTPPVPAPPAQLIAGVRDFTGRHDELERLDRHAAGAADAVAIVTITGPPGVGKTALAVHWAHRSRDRFPDGQLYLNLRGFDAAQPVDPPEALSSLLVTLGVPAARVPVTVDAASAVYRSALAGKRVLVVLDNAGDEAQVRPLLPGGPGTMVLVTSRERLSGLTAREGARTIELPVFTTEESRQLLASIVGADRIASEPAASTELAGACGHLPLALRVVAANLAGRPVWTIAEEVEHLRGGEALAGLDVDGDPDSSVRAALNTSYRRLPDATQRVFRLLGLVPGPDVTATAAAALTGLTPADAAGHLARLARGHLVEEGAGGRFGLHDLIRAYARSLVTADEARDGAWPRLLDHYLRHADAAGRLLYPEMVRLAVPADPGVRFASPAAARDWVAREHVNLVAAVRHADRHGPDEGAWLLADALRSHFWFGRQPSSVWISVAEAGRAAARRSGDPRAEAAAELNIAMAYLAAGRLTDSAHHNERAAALADRADWTDLKRGALNNVGLAYTDLGQLEVAAKYFREAEAVARTMGDAPAIAFQLLILGRNHYLVGGPRGAAAMIEEALRLARSIPSPGLEAEALRCLGEISSDLGDQVQALAYARIALEITTAHGDSRAADAHNTVATIKRRCGDAVAAIRHHELALGVSSSATDAYRQCQALLGLSAAHLSVADIDAAIGYARQALTITQETGYRLIEGHAYAALAEVGFAAGDVERARADSRRALELHRASGDRMAQARDLLMLGRLGGDAVAVAGLRDALDTFMEFGARPEAAMVRGRLAELTSS